MAAVSITATEVLPSAAADIRTGTVGASTTVTAGVMVYVDAATSTLLKTTAQTSAATAAAAGMCLNGGSTGQVVRYVVSDTALQLGSTAAIPIGTVLVLDDAAGLLATTYADLDAGDFVTTCGTVTALTNGVTRFQINPSGVAKQ